MRHEHLNRVYCATPSRLAYKTDEICNYIANKGQLPMHPFKMYPLHLYEGNPKFLGTEHSRRLIRRQTMLLCFEDVRRTDSFALFGISNGTMQEAEVALEYGKHIDLPLWFDPEWEIKSRELAAEDIKIKHILKELASATKS